MPDHVITWNGSTPDAAQHGAFEKQASAPATVDRTETEYVLSVRGAGIAVLQFNQQPIPREWPWWAPLGANSLGRAHRISWDAVTNRTAPYLVIMKTGRLMIQVTVAGIMVTAPNGTGDVSEKTLTAPIVTDGTRHRWEVVAEPKLTSLAIDGNAVWSIPRSAELGEAISIGDATRDREHGGEVRLSSLRYERKPARVRDA